MTKTASPKQIDFLRSLDAEREGFRPSDLVSTLAGTREATSTEASQWIGALLRLPKKAKPAPAPSDALHVALAAAVPSMYAIPTAGLILPGVNMTGDLLFVEVRPWKGRNYLNRLHGAPGHFTRSRFTRSQSLGILAVIAGKHLEYARLFGEKFTVCGRCAAPLTDQRSRELFLGPTCAQHFGVKF